MNGQRLLYLFAVPGFLAMSIVPISVFVVTLDRILVNKFHVTFTDSRRRIVFRAHIGAICLFGLLNLIGLLFVAVVDQQNALQTTPKNASTGN